MESILVSIYEKCFVFSDEAEINVVPGVAQADRMLIKISMNRKRTFAMLEILTDYPFENVCSK